VRRELSKPEFGDGGLEMPVKNQKAKTKNRPTGLTITEVIVASALLAIALVPILKALTTVHVGTATIEQKTFSLTLAQAKLDEIRASSVYHYSDSFAQLSTPISGQYLCSVLDVPQSSNLRQITVKVGRDLNGNSQLGDNEVEVTLTSYVARRI
jgi:hypothetical protein